MANCSSCRSDICREHSGVFATCYLIKYTGNNWQFWTKIIDEKEIWLHIRNAVRENLGRVWKVGWETLPVRSYEGVWLQMFHIVLLFNIAINYFAGEIHDEIPPQPRSSGPQVHKWCCGNVLLSIFPCSVSLILAVFFPTRSASCTRLRTSRMSASWTSLWQTLLGTWFPATSDLTKTENGLI